MPGRASQAFDRLNGDAAFERLLNEDAGDQRARFGPQLAQARLDASQQRAEFDIQLAKLESELAEALHDASEMRVRTQLMHAKASMHACMHADCGPVPPPKGSLRLDMCTVINVHAGIGVYSCGAQWHPILPRY